MLIRSRKIISFMFMLCLDYLVVIASVVLAIYVRNIFFNSNLIINNLEIFLLISLFFIYLQYSNNLYRTSNAFWQNMENIFRNCIILLIVLVVYQYVISNGMLSQIWGGIFVITLFILDVIAKYIAKQLLIKLNFWKNPVLLFSTQEDFKRIKDYINKSNIGYKIYNDNPIEASLTVVKKIPIKDFLFVASDKDNEEIIKAMQRLQPYSNNTYYMLAAGNKICANIEMETFIDHKIAMVKINNLLYFKRIQIIKRIFDLMSSVIGTLIISPLLLYICYRIKKDSPGKIIYDGLRIGQNGKMFKCYKFRSMYINGDEILAEYFIKYPEKRMEWEVFHKLEDDPRVTPFGKLMRRTSLDELPQLFNVIKGDMSLVGPRPYLKQEMEEMGDAVNTIMLAKPGITGYWQVNGRSDVTFENRLIMDCWYIGNWSFWLDLVLLGKTIGIVLDKKGAR